jgi:hypothetical protein
MWPLMFFAGFCVGVGSMWAHLLLRAKRRVASTMRRAQMQRLPPKFEQVLHDNLWNLYSDEPNGKPARNPDFWDIAQDTEPRRVAYRFLGMTGFEE